MSLEDAKEVLKIEEQGIAAVRENMGEEFIQAVELILACPTRLVITGIGKSGLIGQKITATLNSTGTPSFFCILLKHFMATLAWSHRPTLLLRSLIQVRPVNSMLC